MTETSSVRLTIDFKTDTECFEPNMPWVKCLIVLMLLFDDDRSGASDVSFKYDVIDKEDQ